MLAKVSPDSAFLVAAHKSLVDRRTDQLPDFLFGEFFRFQQSPGQFFQFVAMGRQ